MYVLFELDFLYDPLMQALTNTILHQRMENVWNKKSIYTLKLFPNPMKQVTKCHVFQSCVIVLKYRDLDVGW